MAIKHFSFDAYWGTYFGIAHSALISAKLSERTQRTSAGGYQ